MTVQALAALHARAMTVPEPWSAVAIAGLLVTQGCFLVTVPDASEAGSPHSPPQPITAFAMGRIAAGEVELLTIAVDPSAQGQGVGRACLRKFQAECRNRQATDIFLEVAEQNAPALGLYRSEGFREDGVRKAYYRVKGAAPVDAILMSKSLEMP